MNIANEAEVLPVVWETLNIARENTALLLARQGQIINSNKICAKLLGTQPTRLIGARLTELVREEARETPGEQRWETTVKAGRRHIPVEITRCTLSPPLDNLEVYAIRDLRERRATAKTLARQGKLLREQEQDLQAHNAILDAALSNMFQGLAMFDADQNLVFANDRFAEMYGQLPDEVKPGTPLREIINHRIKSGYYVGTTSDEVLQRMRARVARGTASHMTAKMGDGRTIAVSITPRSDGGWVTTHQDITDREKLHEHLEAQKRTLEEKHEQLDAALENMLQGLAMFDSEQRLIVCNSRYAEMYRLTSDQVKPGTTVKEILQQRIANGCYQVRDTEGFLNSWTSSFGDVSARVQELADGRLINVTRRSLSNGGRLITHEDITERQRLTAQLAEQHRLLTEQENRLKVQNVQLDAALNNMVQGLAMFDAEYRLILCNARYAEIYGFSSRQVARGTSLREIIQHRMCNGLLADRTPDAIVEAMLRRRADANFEQFYNQLSDGRCIAITVQPMADGGTVTTHQDITEQRRSEAKITHMALHDALTGLPNRTLLNERLEQALARASRGELVAVHMLDLDHFKHVNDTLGHPAGDKLLNMVTSRLLDLVRDLDTVARMGGDEFAILQVGITGPADATALAGRINEALCAPYTIDGQEVVIGTSVGIALGPVDGDTTEQILRNADLALYRAKGDGRGTYSVFEAGMDTQMRERKALEQDLRRALVGQEFELHYQPVVDLSTNTIAGFEALMRWRHPERGMVSPAAFIPLAEQTGLIVPIGEWAIRDACRTAAKWRQALKVAVNLSAAQFKKPGLVQVVASALANSGLEPELLELEVTETVLLQDNETTLGTLFQLRALGVRIAMDDFGTGYSSLSYLQKFPFDKIKIDRSFVKDVAENAGSRNIVRAVAALAKGLGITTTAEGVETTDQLEAIIAEGCSEMQGFLFSRPLPAEEIERRFLTEQTGARSATG